MQNFEKRSDKFIKKCKIFKYVLANVLRNKELRRMYRQIFQNIQKFENVLTISYKN